MTRGWLIAVASTLVFLVGSYLFMVYALPLVLPFAAALIVAELIDPLVNRLTWKGKVPRGIAVGVIVLVFVGLIVTAMTAGIARLVHEIEAISEQLPYLYAALVDVSNSFAEQFGAFNETLPASIQEVLARNLADLQQSVSQRLPTAAQTLGVFSSLPVFLTNMLVAIIATFFMSRDKQVISNFLLSLFPREWRKQIQQVTVDVWESAMNFAKAQFFLILLAMAQSIIGLHIIGSNYAVLLGVVIGVADLMPVLGPAAIYLPWIAYSLIFGNHVFGIKLLVLYGLVAAVRQVLEPKMVGDQLGLHPLAILLSIYLGFHFFGAAGFVIGPLMAILLKSVVQAGLLPSLNGEPPSS